MFSIARMQESEELKDVMPYCWQQSEIIVSLNTKLECECFFQQTLTSIQCRRNDMWRMLNQKRIDIARYDIITRNVNNVE